MIKSTHCNRVMMVLFLLSTFCFRTGNAVSQESGYDPLAVPAAKIDIRDMSAHDRERERDIPIRIFLPPRTATAPIVLFSHGLGGSCKMNTFLGEHWAAMGFFTVFLQHPGSDITVWQHLPSGEERMKALAKAANMRTFRDRVKDVSAVIDTLEMWNKTPDHPFFGRMDSHRIGMSGHSFGAVTTQAVSGQKTILGTATFTDKRISAAMMFSPSKPMRGSSENAFGSVTIPWMIMTGTKDVSSIGEGDLASRLAVFPALPPGGKYELVLHNAEHSAFTDRALPGETGQRNPNHHRVIKALSTAFWEAYLAENRSAKQWLDGSGPESVLEKNDRWRKKTGDSKGVLMSEKTTAEMKEIASLAEEAYVFALPMLENLKTMDRIAGPDAPSRAPRKFNTLLSNSKLLGPEFKKIVAPNNDTVYSSTWLDLSREPLVLSVPDIPDQRYYVFQMVNMYNYNFGYIGARTTGFSRGNYLIAEQGWTGEVPASIDKVFRSETRFVFLFGRTLIDGPEDVERLKAVQKGYSLAPLSRYLGKPLPEDPPDPVFPRYDAGKASSPDFIAYLNFILGNALIHPDDRPLLDRFAKIGVGPGKPFSGKDLSEAMREAIQKGIADGKEKISKKGVELGKKVNGWTTLADSHGPREIMGKKRLVNAVGAAVALYGNDKEEANNYTCSADVNGNPLDGLKTKYVLRFEKDHLPPVKAFWSITMYEPPLLTMVENPIRRYSIGDRTKGLVYGEDGSLTIYIQHESPGPEKESNWLPCPAGPFVLALRNYWPDMERFPLFVPPSVRPI